MRFDVVRIIVLILVFSTMVAVFSSALVHADDVFSSNEPPWMIHPLPIIIGREDCNITIPINLTDHFDDDITNVTDLRFGIELRGENSTMIRAGIIGFGIFIDSTMTKNFYSFKSIEGRIAVTDTGDRNNSDPMANYSNWFAVYIEPVNDKPVWNEIPPIAVYEDTPSKDIMDLSDFITGQLIVLDGGNSLPEDRTWKP